MSNSMRSDKGKEAETKPVFETLSKSGNNKLTSFSRYESLPRLKEEEEKKHDEGEYNIPLLNGAELWCRYDTKSEKGADWLDLSPEALLAYVYRIKKKHLELKKKISKLQNMEKGLYSHLKRTQGKIRARMIADTYNRIFGKNNIFTDTKEIFSLIPRSLTVEEENICIANAHQLHEDFLKDISKVSKDKSYFKFDKFISAFNHYIKNKQWNENVTPCGNSTLSTLEFKNYFSTQNEFAKLRKIRKEFSDKIIKTDDEKMIIKNIDDLFNEIYYAEDDAWFLNLKNLHPKEKHETKRDYDETFKKYDTQIYNLIEKCSKYKTENQNILNENQNASEKPQFVIDNDTTLNRYNNQVFVVENLLEKIERIDWPANSYTANNFEPRLDPVTYIADREHTLDNHRFIMKKMSFTRNKEFIAPKGITILFTKDSYTDNKTKYRVYDHAKKKWTTLNDLTPDEMKELNVVPEKSNITLEYKRLSSTLIDKLAPIIDLKNQLQPYLFPGPILNMWSQIRRTKVNPNVPVDNTLKEIALLSLRESYKTEKNTPEEIKFYTKIADLIDLDETFNNIKTTIENTKFDVFYKKYQLNQDVLAGEIKINDYVPEGISYIHECCRNANIYPKEKLKYLLDIIKKVNDKNYNFSFSSFFGLRDKVTADFYQCIFGHIVLKKGVKLKSAIDEIKNFSELPEVALDNKVATPITKKKPKTPSFFSKIAKKHKFDPTNTEYSADLQRKVKKSLFG